jgi:hypothetical protein
MNRCGASISSLKHDTLRLCEKNILPQISQISAEEISHHPSEIPNSFGALREKYAPADVADQRK